VTGWKMMRLQDQFEEAGAQIPLPRPILFASMGHACEDTLETPRFRPSSTSRAPEDFAIRQPSFADFGDDLGDDVASMEPEDIYEGGMGGARARSPSLSPSSISVPSAPRKKPPVSPVLSVQAGSTASASKCRERLAAAARAHRWQQEGGRSPSGGAGGRLFDDAMDMGNDKENLLNRVPRTEPRTREGDCPVERSNTFRGTRKRLDDTLDDIRGQGLVTPKRMRVAEELFSKMRM